MSITIRLTRTGKKNAPSYRLVVTNTKSKRDGKYIEKLGFFNPISKPAQFEYDKKKYAEWVEKGAQVSEAVTKLVSGKYEYKPYRKAVKGEETTSETTEAGNTEETSQE